MIFFCAALCAWTCPSRAWGCPQFQRESSRLLSMPSGFALQRRLPWFPRWWWILTEPKARFSALSIIPAKTHNHSEWLHQRVLSMAALLRSTEDQLYQSGSYYWTQLGIWVLRRLCWEELHIPSLTRSVAPILKCLKPVQDLCLGPATIWHVLIAE